MTDVPHNGKLISLRNRPLARARPTVAEWTESEIQQRVLDLQIWRSGEQEYFSTRLYSLLSHSDIHNRDRIRRGFPIEVWVFEQWQNARSEREFFLEWAIKP